MYHSALITANVQQMTEQRIREIQNLRAAREARAERRERRRAERRERSHGRGQPARRTYGRAA